ncbi:MULTISPECIES: hypothetical protein [Acidithiobacillus]|uniref:Uncharacterized protein n=2 Tax=Acidithiobacillus TaxID=119977 RepID=A0A179BPD3_ACIFR|nr:MULTISPECIES: hypothetical protein [Acidithiobacillus]MEB8485968.1 hypothetical protein [Acidithiobacillus ferriphilus]MEB8489627.1 hypothetical protein [Acidithiobacillus ferriphilus]MEB8492512.1 hypothetical protein [Acidithiobacillus ferriphilus]MEB8515451.1 hypothetical protein [Acidithiobacillus ferriphilus]MEB8521435.1 hypothetical protein [Acidithiobacillus ferriphilus]
MSEKMCKFASRPAAKKITTDHGASIEDFIKEINEFAIRMDAIIPDEGEYDYAIMWRKTDNRYWEPLVLVLDKTHRTLITIVKPAQGDKGAIVFIARKALKTTESLLIPRVYMDLAAAMRGIAIPHWIDEIFYPALAANGKIERLKVALNVQYETRFRLLTSNSEIPASVDRITKEIEKQIKRATSKETLDGPIIHMVAQVRKEPTREVIMEQTIIDNRPAAN